MIILLVVALGLTGCITTYNPTAVDVNDSESIPSTSEYRKKSIAIFPVEYQGPGNKVRDVQFLIDLQQKLATQISTQGLETVILINDVNKNLVSADYYLKVAFVEDNNGQSAGFIFGLSMGIFPLILPLETQHTNIAHVQVFAASGNKLHSQTVKREGKKIWHSLLIPVGLAWNHHDYEDAIRNDVVNDISKVYWQ